MKSLCDSILLLGRPRLNRVAAPVHRLGDPDFNKEADLLVRTLEAFRSEHGFGRAIAAPQIGIPKRFIALSLGEGPFVMINPEITWRSEDTFTMWDDCMCFPFFLVRLRRHLSVSVRWEKSDGALEEWDRLDQARSELLQHEIDHLDGILATDRQEGAGALVSRAAYEANREVFDRQVDYHIPALEK